MHECLARIRNAVIEGDENDQILSLIDQALQQGVTAQTILQDGLTAAMADLGDAWNRGEVFIPEVIEAAEIFQRAADYLEPHLLAGAEQGKLGTIVIGTVHGDLHNLGKNLVAVMLRTGGFNVVDLGVNVPVQRFIDEAEKHQAQIIGLSALLTTTMVEQKKLIEALVEAGLRDRYKVMVGGAPISEKWAHDIGADGYARNAGEAVVLAKKLLSR
ncbi:MAG: hypothetical protein PWP44_1288 [Thermacetogenium sp.]|nr:hypothetical protein [Thermacetogenium sp.]